MRILTKHLAIVAALAVFVAGCTVVEAPLETETEFFPMELGYRWTYLVHDEDEDFTIEMEAVDELDGWYRLTDGRRVLILKSEDGTLLRAADWPPPDDPGRIRVHLRPPLVEGESWPLYSSGTGPTVELVRADFTYRSETKSWDNCYLIMYNHLWVVYAEGVGLVAEGFLDTELACLTKIDFGSPR